MTGQQQDLQAVRSAVRLEDAAYDDPRAVALVAELDADLRVRYPGGEQVLASPEQFLPARGGAFLVAVVEGPDGPVDAGCAGLRRETAEAAELKRMWVRPAWRGRGVARRLLAACEERAAALGYRALWLETGLAQPEALGLYRAAGYAPVAPFGQWADAPDSVHLGRALPAAGEDGTSAPS